MIQLNAWQIAALETGLESAIEHGKLDKESAESLLEILRDADKIRVQRIADMQNK